MRVRAVVVAMQVQVRVRHDESMALNPPPKGTELAAPAAVPPLVAGTAVSPPMAAPTTCRHLVTAVRRQQQHQQGQLLHTRINLGWPSCRNCVKVRKSPLQLQLPHSHAETESSRKRRGQQKQPRLRRTAEEAEQQQQRCLGPRLWCILI